MLRLKRILPIVNTLKRRGDDSSLSPVSSHPTSGFGIYAGIEDKPFESPIDRDGLSVLA